MLEIPFLQKFIEESVKRHQVGDAVDHLNYFITASILGFFAVATSAKQYFGTPIQCWTPPEFGDGWIKYAEDYCFVSSSYHLPNDASIENSEKIDRDHYSYYRWVPIMLAIQAICFYLPNYLWSVLHQKSRINPLALLNEADKVSEMTGQKRDEEITKLSEFCLETVSPFSSSVSSRGRVTRWNGRNASLMYLAVKVLYMLNIYAQVVLLSKFLAKGYLNWGFQTVLSILGSSSWEESEVFPTVIMCELPVRKLGSLHTYSLQCVIMMNMVYEKIYLFLYVWFFILGIVTLINFCFYLAVFLIPHVRTSVIKYRMDERKMALIGGNRGNVAHFVEACLHPDGVLLLIFLSDHSSGRLSYDLSNKIFMTFLETDSCVSIKACSSLQNPLDCPSLQNPLDSLPVYQSPVKKPAKERVMVPA